MLPYVPFPPQKEDETLSLLFFVDWSAFNA